MGCPLRWDQIAEPECAEPIASVRPTKRSRRRYYTRLTSVVLACSATLVLAVIGISQLFLADRTSTLPAVVGSEFASVAPANTAAARRVGFVIVTGKVINRTAASLRGVEAVIDLLDAHQHKLRTQTAMIECDTVAPGAISNFQVEMPDETQAAAYRLRFRKLNGEYLN